jgi:hypothetical protein
MRITPSLLCFFLIFSAAPAADPAPSSPVDIYISARDHYIAAFKDAAEGDKKADAARNDVERLLRAAVPAWSAPGFPSTGEVNLNCLDDNDLGFSALDGLEYSAGDTSVIVTSRTLLLRWLIRHNAEYGTDKMPVSIPRVFRAGNFWTYSSCPDAATQLTGMVLVKAPPGADLAIAQIAAVAQVPAKDEAPSAMLAAVMRGDRVFIARQKLTVTFDKPEMCKKALDQTLAKSEKALKEYQAAKAKDPKAFDTHQQLEEQADRDYRACFAQHLPAQKTYTAVQKQAQALVDLLH